MAEKRNLFYKVLKSEISPENQLVVMMDTISELPVLPSWLRIN